MNFSSALNLFTKKLHTRIYEELSNHMDDMHEDFSSICNDEKEVTQRVLDEMGNPEKLGYELKNANKENGNTAHNPESQHLHLDSACHH